MSLGLLVTIVIVGFGLALALAEWSVKRYCSRSRTEEAFRLDDNTRHEGDRPDIIAFGAADTRPPSGDNS